MRFAQSVCGSWNRCGSVGFRNRIVALRLGGNRAFRFDSYSDGWGLLEFSTKPPTAG